MLRFLEIATAITLNLIFHLWITPILGTKGWVGVVIAIVLTFVFAFLFLVAMGFIKEPEKPEQNQRMANEFVNDFIPPRTN